MISLIDGPSPLDVCAQVDPVLRRAISWGAAAPAAADVGLERPSAGILGLTNGAGTFSGRLQVGDGAAATPSLFCTSSPTTGLFRGGADILSVTNAATETARFQTDCLNVGFNRIRFGQNLAAVDADLGRGFSGGLMATANGSLVSFVDWMCASVGTFPPVTDISPQSLLYKSQDSYQAATGANRNGASTVIAAGIGIRFFTVVGFAALGGSTVTITINGNANILTEGVDWTAAVSNGDTATSLSNAINALSGVSSSAFGTNVGVQLNQGSFYSLAITSSDLVNLTVTNGTDGTVQIKGAISLPAGSVTSAMISFPLQAASGIRTIDADPTLQLLLGGSTMTTDATATSALLKGRNAYSQSTTDKPGSNLVLAGGIGRRLFTIVDYSLIGAGRTVTITVNGTAYVYTSGVNWTIGVNNIITGADLISRINTEPGLMDLVVGTMPGGNPLIPAPCYLTPTAACYSFSISTTMIAGEGTVTSGTDGVVMAPAGTSVIPGLALGDPGTGISGVGGITLIAASQQVLSVASSAMYVRGAASVDINFGSGANVTLTNIAAANLRQGAAPSATPVAQIFTLGEASRPGTDSNVGGANGTITSGLGTGTGTASYLIFQTPTLAGAGSGTQTHATRLTVRTAYMESSVPMYVPDGSVGTPSYSFSGGTNNGLYFATSVMHIAAAGVPVMAFYTSEVAVEIDALSLGVGSDVQIARLAAGSLRLGRGPSSTPDTQTFTIGEASRPGVDSNVGGATGTIRSGLGTGTGATSDLIFQTPTLAGAGSGVQAYATRLTIATAAVTVAVPLVANDIQITKTAPAIAAGTLTLNLALGNVFAVALTADITTMTMAGIAASGLTSSFQLMFTADGSARAVTYMAGIVWAAGVAPTLTTTNNKRDWLQFATFDGGTTWFGFVLGQNF